MSDTALVRNVGFCCVTLLNSRSTNHTTIASHLSEEKVRTAMEKNIADLEAILLWMKPVPQLRLFRIGSGFIPYYTHDAFKWRKSCWRWYEKELADLGKKYIKKLGYRLSMHPGQYTVLNSPNPAVVKRARKELRYSAKVLDALGCESDAKIIVHPGGVYNDRETSLKRLTRKLKKLPDSVKARLVLENDHYYSLKEVVKVGEATGTPVVFDHLHSTIVPCHNLSKWIKRAFKLWDCHPKVHISSQKPGGIRGAHDFEVFDQDIAAMLNLLKGHAVDLMVEAKGHEVAALYVLNEVFG